MEVRCMTVKNKNDDVKIVLSRVGVTHKTGFVLNDWIYWPLYVKSSQVDFLHCSPTTNFPWLSPTENWLIPEPNEFCHLYSRGTDTHRRKHMSRDHNPQLRESPRTRKTHLPLLLCVGPCLRSCCMATRWSNPLKYERVKKNTTPIKYCNHKQAESRQIFDINVLK
jgi:hypothetical protein